MNPDQLRAHLQSLCQDLDAGRPLRRPAFLALPLALAVGCTHTHTEYAVGLYGAPIPEAGPEGQLTSPPVMRVREVCADGVDNDGDQAVDCDDPDCPCGGELYGAPPMGPDEDCGDGIDNDGDGAIDCQDDDCSCGVRVLYAAP